MTARPAEDNAPFADAMMLFGAAGIAVLGLVVALTSADSAMAFHGFVFLVAGVLAAIAILNISFRDSPILEAARPYMDGPIKVATIAAVLWGIAGFVVGDVLAWQLAFPQLNLDLPWTSFGRLRPLHTSAVIFAFGGNVLLATSFYVVQRTCHTRLAGRWAPWFVVWGYQLFIVIAGTGYLLGVTQGKEYAEPEWYADLWLTIVWVVYLLVFLGTLIKRKEPHIYVANWFYLAFIVTIAMLHLVNNATLAREPDQLQELHRLRGRPGCHDAVVVRPQRRRLLPDRRLPRHHVLLHARSAWSGRSTPTASRSCATIQCAIELRDADLRSDLKTIGIPTLIVHGTEIVFVYLNWPRPCMMVSKGLNSFLLRKPDMDFIMKRKKN